MIKRLVQEEGLFADLFHDGSGQPRKAIVLLGGSEGGKTWSGYALKRPVDHLVGLGYTLLSLAYFKSPGLPPYLEEIPLEYFENAFAWLATQPEVISDELALLGGSKGAEVALLLGSMNSRIKAVVALSPSSVVWPGIPKKGVDMRTARRSSWAFRGKGLPFVPDGISSWNSWTLLSTFLFGTLHKAYEKALQDKSQGEEAIIPVEKIQGAILLISGRRDQMWPSTLMSEQIMSRLSAKGFAHHHEHIVFDTGHNGPVMKKDSWRAISAFLKRHYN
jgi:pimeloyl-ACP methyl ester carboxylesterase